MGRKQSVNVVADWTAEVAVHIDASEKFTVVNLIGHRYYGMGVAMRHPDDEYDRQIGVDIAMARALRDLADKVEGGVRP